MLKNLLLGLSLLAALGCATGKPGAPTSGPSRAAEDNLTQPFAEFRAAQVRNVAYDLSFKLEKGATSYDGTAKIALELARTDAPLTLDFVGKKIHSIQANGVEVTDFSERVGSIEIPARHLAPRTTLTIAYTNDFNLSPTGFYRSVDPTDQREYLYTDFEPYQAHLLYPCLDQPDLKAPFDVHVDAPASWKVISNSVGTSRGSSASGASPRSLTDFHLSEPISTYLFFLGAGDYHEWKDHYGNLPLYLYSRESIAANVDSHDLFDITKRGLAFYESYFGHKYPFPKLGHVFIPDFVWGGMENPGAITLNERNVFRGKASRPELHSRAGLVLHEMAHMWFGDLVTLKWWNDTWLNEAFATYVSMLAQADGLHDQATWNGFLGEKTAGYWEDGLVTTHPIEATIPDTLNARENFDGITYDKGASALQQLRYFVGPDAFKRGVQDYFRRFAWKNTTRADFVAAIARASGKDLGAWTHAWLQTAGPNRVHASFSCEAGKISSFALEQEPNRAGVLSPHRTKVALYNHVNGGAFKLQSLTPVSYESAKTEVPALQGKPCPEFVFPNEGDEDYALFSLDPKSLEGAKAALSSLPDPLLKLMTWATLSQMVDDGQLSPSEYFAIGMRALKAEKDEQVLGVLLGRRSSIKSVFFNYLSPEHRARIAPELEAILWSNLLAAEPGSSMQLVNYDFFVAIVRSGESRARLIGLLDGTTPLKGLKLDQDRRWAALTSLSAAGTPGIENRLEREARVDTSSRGKAFAYAARIAEPNAGLKAMAWQDLLTPGKLDETTFRYAKNWFADPNRPELMRPFAGKFFVTVSRLAWNDQVHRDRVRPYFDSLFPSLCTSDLLKESQESLKSDTEVNDAVKKAWLQANDKLSRCVRARALDRE